MEDENFGSWLLENEQIVKEIINIDPDYIVGYLSEIEGTINSEGYLDMIYWELGQEQKFEQRQRAAKYLWVQSRIEKLKKLYEEIIRD
jgi:hypothetical protein